MAVIERCDVVTGDYADQPRYKVLAGTQAVFLGHDFADAYRAFRRHGGRELTEHEQRRLTARRIYSLVRFE